MLGRVHLMMKASHGLWILTAVVALAGCPPDDTGPETAGPTTGSSASPATSSTTTTSSSSTGPTVIKPQKAQKPPIKARIKDEVDNKDPDAGYSGTKLTVSGSKGAFVAPLAWDTQGQKSESKDKKSGFYAMSGGDTPSSKSNRDAAATKLGLSDCDWGPEQAVKMGKDKVAATVADGVCLRGSTVVVRTGYAAITDADYKLLAMGGWDDAGGKAKGVFDTFRSLMKDAGGKAKPGGVAACCAVIKQNKISAPPNQQGAYTMALGACQAAMAAGLPMQPSFSKYCK